MSQTSTPHHGQPPGVDRGWIGMQMYKKKKKESDPCRQVPEHIDRLYKSYMSVPCNCKLPNLT